MDSLIKPSELFKRAKELGQPAIAVTDHGTCAGLWDCLKLSRSTGVKLIAGCEIYFVDDVNKTDTRLRHVILLAKNAEGYRNLLTAVKEGFDNNVIIAQKVYPRIDWNILKKYSSGLICTTACGNGIIAQLLNDKKFDKAREQANKLKEIFGDDLAIELQPNGMRRKANLYGNEIDQVFTNRQLKKLADELGIKCIVATDAHYVKPGQHKAHDVMLAIGARQPISSGARLKYDVPDFYMKSGDEVMSKLKRMFGEAFAKECVDNTVYFADKCEFPEWIDPKYSNPSGKELPEFPVRDQKDYGEFKEWQINNNLSELAEDKAYLRYRCEIGLNKKTDFDQQAPYRERLVEEFDVLEFHGFSSYMLIVADYIEYCRKNNIRVGPGRGSVGGSLVGYLLEIHFADPLKYNLIFARFYNKEKTSPPDIDIDFPSSKRDLVQKYIRDKYGEDHVAHVSNVNTLTPKPYVKAIARTFEYGGDRKAAVAIGNAIADAIPAEIKTIKSALEKAPLFIEYAKRYPELAEFADDVCGKAVAWSTHAGGLIIGARPLTGLIPLRRDKDGNIAIEYEKERAEENGLVKMDTLAVETLDNVDNTYELIKAAGKEAPLDPPDYDECDNKTYDLISNGNTFGVFQLGTSGGTIDLCRKMAPENIEDLAIINSLARPSARDIRKDFIKTRKGDLSVNIIHPSLERAFRPTLGFGLYEECLMYLAQDVAGWSLHDADRLRKLTKAKGKYPEKVKKWEEDFIQGAITNGISKKFATKIWNEVVDNFQGYGFNHSVHFSQAVDIYTKEGQLLYSKPIQDVKPGEFVKSRNEVSEEDVFIEVINNHDHGEQELVEVELETSERVKCTLAHKFRTETGEMLPLKQIIRKAYSIVVKEAKTRNIKSVKPIGKHKTYDLEVDHPDHQYYLSNGILTSNSHAIFYSFLGYHTAYLKAHYPLEFLVANLMSEVNSNAPSAKDKIAKIKEEIRKLNVKILPPNINTSNMTFSIIDDQTLLTGFDALKDMGKNAIPEILAKRPFHSFEDFLSKVDGKKVTAPSVKALAASGSLDSFGLTRKQMYLYTSDIKKKIQVHVKKSKEEFKYPWPEVEEWTTTELHAMEREYLGEGVTGTKFEVYNGFFTKTAASFKKLPKLHPPPPDDMTDKEQRKYTKHITMLQAEVKNFFEFKVKKEDSKIFGEVMAKVTLSDPWGNQMNMTCFPEGWVHLQNRIDELLNNKHKFEPGVGLYINGELNWYEGEISLIFGDVARCCPPPQMPEDREARKVAMRSSRKKRTEEPERDILVEEIEEELIEKGFSDLDDEDEEIKDGFV